MKRKLQKARAAAKELPDMERTVKEQEEEIRELEERIRMQRGVLEGLREEGLRVGREREGKMET
jgi:predicted RNase H-like nuclease (RuvC/YqgF family)